MAKTKNNAKPEPIGSEHQPGPPRARNLGWDENEQAWRFLHLETGEEFWVDLFAVTGGHYEIAGKVYRKG